MKASKQPITPVPVTYTISGLTEQEIRDLYDVAGHVSGDYRKSGAVTFNDLRKALRDLGLYLEYSPEKEVDGTVFFRKLRNLE